MADYRVLIYRRTNNLGDAVQTAALSRLLPGQLAGVYRHLAADAAPGRGPTFVVNGWLGDAVPIDADNSLFAGIHLGRRQPEQLGWVAQSRYAVGSRDPYTAEYLRLNDVHSEMVGCATLTLDRYDGPRAGRFAVDWPQPYATFLTNRIEDDMSWPEQWSLALQLLDTLRMASVVHTTRLHVALPCLAMGTPVVVPRRAVDSGFQPQRFSLLDDLGFRYDEPFTMDVSPWADRYVRFLSAQLGKDIRPGPFKCPTAG